MISSTVAAVTGGVNTRGGLRFAGILALAGLTGCGGGRPLLVTGAGPPVADSSEHPTDESEIGRMEDALVSRGIAIGCEPTLFASDDVAMAQRVDEWLERGEIGRGEHDDDESPSAESFRVAEMDVRIDRRRSLSGTRAAFTLDGRAAFSYLEAATVADEPSTGRLSYIVHATPTELVGSFCRVANGWPTTCRYASVGADGSIAAIGPSMPPLVDALSLDGASGDEHVIIGHPWGDETLGTVLVVDRIDRRTRTVRREVTTFDAKTVYFGARVRDAALTLLGATQDGWQARAADGSVSTTTVADDPRRGARACGAVRARVRVRLPVRFDLGGVSLDTTYVVPPVELVYAEDDAGMCESHIELASRDGGGGSLDGSLGGLLRPAAPDAAVLEGRVLTYFGPLEVRCAIEH